MFESKSYAPFIWNFLTVFLCYKCIENSLFSQNGQTWPNPENKCEICECVDYTIKCYSKCATEITECPFVSNFLLVVNEFG